VKPENLDVIEACLLAPKKARAAMYYLPRTVRDQVLAAKTVGAALALLEAGAVETVPMACDIA
jgi:hypothetical protein